LFRLTTDRGGDANWNLEKFSDDTQRVSTLVKEDGHFIVSS
jgi:hypothetical protein